MGSKRRGRGRAPHRKLTLKNLCIIYYYSAIKMPRLSYFMHRLVAYAINWSNRSSDRDFSMALTIIHWPKNEDREGLIIFGCHLTERVSRGARVAFCTLNLVSPTCPQFVTQAQQDRFGAVTYIVRLVYRTGCVMPTWTGGKIMISSWMPTVLSFN